MGVKLFTICWNEADFLEFFFRHYDRFVDDYVVYDDGSTDGSLDILHDHPGVEVRRFDRSVQDSFVESHQRFHNDVWKSSRGNVDWVIITALDEHLHFPGKSPRDHLSKYQKAGATMIPALGYQMLSDEFPSSGELLFESRTIGAFYRKMCKLSIFNPDAIEETNFGVGRHLSFPTGTLKVAPWDELVLLHYRFLGFERTFERNKALQKRLGAKDLEKNWANTYHGEKDYLRTQWDEFEAHAIDIASADFRPWHHAPVGARWWRPEDFVDNGPPW